MQLLFSGAVAGATSAKGVLGILGVLDAETGKVLHRCEYLTPEKHRAPGQKMQITGFSRGSDSLFACTHNEILVFDEWPPKNPVETLSLPGFNDLHHCMHYEDSLAVANTGLETVDLISFSGELEQRWDVLEGVSEARVIRDDVDYRLLPDTKPHLRHPNHLFELEGELWATQLRSSDAICLSSPEKRMEMRVGMPHDGEMAGEEVVFTTTNGHLVFHHPEHPERFRSYDLASMTQGQNQLGWCRGIAPHPRDANRFFVCFTKMRRTRWKEFAYRVKHGHEVPQGRICEFDLAEQRIITTHLLGMEDPGYILFQVEVLPESHWL